MTEIKKQLDEIKKIKREKIFNFNNLNKFIYSIIIIIGVYYMTNINDLIVKGFKLQELRKQINVLAETNKNLEYQKMTRETYTNVSQRARNLKMVVAANVDYIELNNGVVAKR